ncbi:tRNA (guanine(9)-N(1))-methyltransferase [Orbilia oligospora]|uniref:tRNA (guanine(9)-N1)-methyltransferase n=1 Tax=Orbilia oligospora TaxID=2813651 RepID=A0A7C8P8Z4_ORBOL|nr:tRNA (guanine(9)-N(1))-methyltransferase [Orbilia oligospora]
MSAIEPSIADSVQVEELESTRNDRKRKRSSSLTAASSVNPAEASRQIAESPTTADESDDRAAPLSKNQQKKLLKKQKWEESRESRRALRREKMAAKRIRQREERDAANANLQTSKPTGGPKSGNKRKNNRKLERKSKRLPIKCIVDCSFDEYMMDKEVASLGAQVSRCYSDNRIAKFSMDLWVTCVDKRLRSHLYLMHGDKWKSWRKIHVTDADYELTKDDIHARNVIYLSSDSDEMLETLEEGKTYIVGGIVDKNRYKGLCFNKAVGQGLRTAKLPIGEYIKMTGRITLTTNQVVEIMLRWLELKDWKIAFEAVIPMRKKKQKKDLTGSQHKYEEDLDDDSKTEDDGEDIDEVGSIDN